MNKIKFNNTEFEVLNYSKNTYFNEGSMSSNASCAIKTDDVSNLHTFGLTPITSIEITHDDTVIYTLDNIHARVSNIGEYLETDHININIDLIFDMNE